MPIGIILLFLAFLSCLKPPPLHLAYLDCLYLVQLVVSSELNLSFCYFFYSFLFIIFFICLWPCWVPATAGAVPHSGTQGATLQLQGVGLSCCEAQALGAQAAVVAARGLRAAASRL